MPTPHEVQRKLASVLMYGSESGFSQTPPDVLEQLDAALGEVIEGFEWVVGPRCGVCGLPERYHPTTGECTDRAL